VTTSLIDARTDQTLWSESYDRDLTDIFAIQSEIGQMVASTLRARLSLLERRDIAEQPTNNLEAYDLYLQGKNYNARALGGDRAPNDYYFNAIRSLEEAIRKDPEFALAYCQLASAHVGLYAYYFDRTPKRRALAETAINEALRLRPDLPEVRLVAADFFYSCYRDYDQARVHVAIAERARPNNPDAFFLAGLMSRRQGDWEGSVRSLQKAVTLDPRNFSFLDELATSHEALGQYQAYEQIYGRWIELGPGKPYLNALKASAAMQRAADLTQYQAALALCPPSLDDVDVTSLRIHAAILSRNWLAAREVLRISSYDHLRFLEQDWPLADWFPVNRSR
jgi:tetratricopeptide (TPR) repeat protein